ncbi:lipase 3-like [Musca autumnalis]|uniref:lipase 3-like n=1 Tax=Musca autumnalis TaxID=221902 RepID=UPI003CED2ADE
MKQCLWIVLLVTIVAVGAQPTAELLRYFQDPNPQITLRPKITTADRIASHGYPAETHEVVTEDGYILTVFRIPYSHKLQNQNAQRPIVLIQHGLFSCSDAWMCIGPETDLGFLMADAGYEVWFGNARGTTYGRKHVSRSTNHPYFWRFSWHEIGNYDIAAIIDYALATNGQGQKSLHYVGHSQGTTVFFALMSSRPEYNAKIKTAHMLAPVAFMSNMSDKLVRALSPYLGHHNTYAAFFKDQEFIPHNELFSKLLYNACAPHSKFRALCNMMAYLGEGVMDNVDFGLINNWNMSAIPTLMSSHPGGCSTNQICHYMQEQQSGCFCLYDHGKTKNMQVYGQPTPPDYPVEKITCEVHLWYGDNDTMAAVEDVERLAEKLPNRVMHHMEDPTWAHADFAWHKEVRQFINDPIVEIINNYENNM